MPVELLERSGHEMDEPGQLGVVDDVVEHDVLVIVRCLVAPYGELIHLVFRELEANVVVRSRW
eukprot:6978527-Heterocapsa_arctica.AAC.1